MLVGSFLVWQRVIESSGLSTLDITVAYAPTNVSSDIDENVLYDYWRQLFVLCRVTKSQLPQTEQCDLGADYTIWPEADSRLLIDSVRDTTPDRKGITNPALGYGEGADFLSANESGKE
ncbi:unnamed protein product [Soboliphyme baturini]|uniref:DUF4936 family protein n=1 Tax=Soboliphyme baturini TaxID=241478 RepID=A0A183IYQ9_9BILA|nr:unnamed protein product [Soboliphyme baturini]